MGHNEKLNTPHTAPMPSLKCYSSRDPFAGVKFCMSVCAFPARLWECLLRSVLSRLPHPPLVPPAGLCVHAGAAGGHVRGLPQPRRQEKTPAGVCALKNWLLPLPWHTTSSPYPCLYVLHLFFFLFFFKNQLILHSMPLEDKLFKSSRTIGSKIWQRHQSSSE